MVSETCTQRHPVECVRSLLRSSSAMVWVWLVVPTKSHVEILFPMWQCWEMGLPATVWIEGADPPSMVCCCSLDISRVLSLERWHLFSQEQVSFHESGLLKRQDASWVWSLFAHIHFPFDLCHVLMQDQSPKYSSLFRYGNFKGMHLVNVSVIIIVVVFLSFWDRETEYSYRVCA